MAPRRATLDTTRNRRNLKTRTTPRSRILRETSKQNARQLRLVQEFVEIKKPSAVVIESKQETKTAEINVSVVAELNEDYIDTPIHRGYSRIDRTLAWFPTHLNHAGLYYLATVVLIAGMWISVQAYVAEMSLKQSVLASDVTEEQVVDSGEEPAWGSEVKPSSHDIDKYSVPPSESRVIRIPSIDVEARIEQVAETSSGAVATPHNLFDVGWYAGSDKVGKEIGSAFMMGHREGYTQKGIFHDLDQLEYGDLIEVELGNNKVIAFKVVTMTSFDIEDVDMDKALSPVNKEVFGLNLMTCVGSYLTDDSTYSQRLLIRAEQVL